MKIIGHRGAQGLAPENTLVSIEHALNHGVDEVEFDVRVTKDHVPVLSHDDALQVGDQHIPIATHTVQELRKYKADLVSLDGALNFIEARASVYIEIKPGEPVKPIIKVLNEYLESGMYTTHNVSIASFSQKTLLDAHRLTPEIDKVVISRWSSVWATLRARQVNTKRISLNQRWLWRGFLRGMQRGGWKISPYTINDVERANKWRPYVYGIITDQPDLFEDRP